MAENASTPLPVRLDGRRRLAPFAAGMGRGELAKSYRPSWLGSDWMMPTLGTPTLGRPPSQSTAGRTLEIQVRFV